MRLIELVNIFSPLSEASAATRMSTLVVALANRLLARETWARACLSPYASYQFCVQVSSLKLFFIILENGQLQAKVPEPENNTSTPNAEADVTITFPLHALYKAILPGSLGLLRVQGVDIKGDAQCAKALSTVLEHLRWDIEEDLSFLFGDMLAHRTMQHLQATHSWVRQRIARLFEYTADYGLDERPAMVRKEALHTFSLTLQPLSETVEALETRIKRLEKKMAL